MISMLQRNQDERTDTPTLLFVVRCVATITLVPVPHCLL